jgi:phage tail-like protein
MSDEKPVARRDVLKGAAAGGFTVATAASVLKADARVLPAFTPPGRDVPASSVFSLEFESQNLGFFTECTGIGSEHEVIEHKVVDETGQAYVQKIPGRLKWNDVTLKRGITPDLAIWKWRDKVVEGKVGDARGYVSITQYTPDGQAAAQWNFVNAWPSKVTAGSERVPSANLMNCDVNIETVEEVTIVHEGMSRET